MNIILFVNDKTEKKKEYEIFLKTLRGLREFAGVRQVDLARKLNKPQSFVSKYEIGERRVDFLELLEICRALDISIFDFIKSFEQEKNEGKR